MARPYYTLDDLELKGRTALVRVDINSPIENGRIQGTDRIEAAADTVDEIARRGAKVVLIAHQGRLGSEDFTSLEQHAHVLDEASTTPVSFVADVAGDAALDAIRNLEPGHALLLDNVRGIEAETAKVGAEQHARAAFVTRLAEVADVYINDAFSAAHRDQASLTGFPRHLVAAAGPTMDRELTAIYDATGNPERPSVYVLGGAKAEDSLDVMEHNLRAGKVDEVLLGGIIADLFIHARGHRLGNKTTALLQRKGLLDLMPRCQALLEEHDHAIVTPEDVAVKAADGSRDEIPVEGLPTEGIILDIGTAAMEDYAARLAEAGSIMMNGPVGAYEDEAFGDGTRAVLGAIAESDAFSLLGGGHTITALHEYGLTFDDFGYVSLAGGALMAAITGRELPAVKALELSRERFPLMES